MPRFVILEHDHPHLHWDLMLETGAVLRTWRLAEPPSAGKVIEAVALPEHRRMYLDYEGPVSDNRGRVRRWETGEYQGTCEGEDIDILLQGWRLHGQVTLNRTVEGTWQFRIQDDPGS